MHRLLALERSVEQAPPSDLSMGQESPFSTFRTLLLLRTLQLDGTRSREATVHGDTVAVPYRPGACTGTSIPGSMYWDIQGCIDGIPACSSRFGPWMRTDQDSSSPSGVQMKYSKYSTDLLSTQHPPCRPNPLARVFRRSPAAPRIPFPPRLARRTRFV